MTRYVVDASVILKWVLGEEQEADQTKAENLLNAWVEGRIELAAPTLWQYEVGNFLGRELPRHAGENMGLLLNLRFRTIDLNEGMCRQCFEWMRKNRVTFYDAAYLAVAFEIQGTLITADERFVKRMGKIEQLCLLKNLDLGFSAPA
jgi:predicted nucleic acid-binding protein